MTALADAPKVPVATHNKAMAAEFLTILDPGASRFTFQFFSDSGRGYPEVFHGSLDQVWPKVEAQNTPTRGMGVFVTINETDLQGRKRENIIRARALVADADNADQRSKAADALRESGVLPSMVVQTSRDRAHIYFPCDDIPLEDFSAYQTALIEKLGTDPSVKDLPRVMRLPGSLHLKDPNSPQKVILKKPADPRRWKIAELTAAFGLQAAASASATGAVNPQRITPKVISQAPWGDLAAGIFTPAEGERLGRKFGSHLTDDLSAGIETNIEEIRSAVTAIPPTAIASESEWMRFARGLAHEARIYGKQSEELWEILDSASRHAPGYNQAENRERRWLRYMSEALDRDNPITIASVFDLAKKHGWQGGRRRLPRPTAA